MVVSKDVESIEPSDLTALIDGRIPENSTLEFKAQLPGRSDSERKEFLADVSAFSNARGGYLLYGIEERDGCAAAIPGVDATDQNIQVLESLLASGIEPRISHRIRVIDVGKAQVLVIKVERSWNPPHQVVLKGDDRFYTRTASRKDRMDIQELRRLFLSSTSIREHAKSFRSDQVKALLKGEGPVELAGTPNVALHILPFSSLQSPQILDQTYLTHSNFVFRPMGDVGNWGARFTYEGRISTSSDGNGAVSYVHIHRDGIVEAVICDLLRDGHYANGPGISFVGIEKEIVQTIPKYLSLLSQQKLSGPKTIAISYLNVKGAIPFNPNRFSMNSPSAIRQDCLLLPEVLIERDEEAVPELFKKVFDIAWNAAGMSGSPNFSEAGQWTTPL